MRVDELPAALDAAAAHLRASVPALDADAAQVIVDTAKPPRATGALASSGRVIANAAVFGGGLVDYAAPVNKATGFLDLAAQRAEDTALELADAVVADAITL